jgi:hypothetical protein
MEFKIPVMTLGKRNQSWDDVLPAHPQLFKSA